MNKKIYNAIAIVAIFFVVLTCFTACNSDKTKDAVSVNFMDGDTLLKRDDNASEDNLFTPSKEGYEFVGWYLDVGLKKEFKGNLYENIVLYAKWEIKQYTVKFIDYDGSVLSVDNQDTQLVNYGESAIAPKPPKREFYKFKGWDKDFKTVKSDMTIKAQYEKQNISVKFYFNEDSILSGEVESKEKFEQCCNTALADMDIPNGFEFDCWCLDNKLTIPLNLNNLTAESVSLYARLKISELENAKISKNFEAEGFIYSENPTAELTADFEKIDGIDYSYNWQINNESILDNYSQSLNLPVLDVGTYNCNVTITAEYKNAVSLVEKLTIDFEIFPADLKNVTANDSNIIYDGKSHFIEILGLKDDDKISYKNSNNDYTKEKPIIKNTGEYNLYVKILRKNYKPLIISANLKIEAKELTVKIKDKIISYGDTMPKFDYMVNGFVEGENEADLNGKINFECEIINTLKVGVYDIKADGLSATNYNIKYEEATITIKPRDLKITAQNCTITYGDNMPSFNVNYNGFINGDDENSLNGELKFVCNYGKGSDAKNYTITPYGLKSENYNIKFIDGILTVNKKTLSVTANDLEITYGDGIPNFTVNYDGFINGDDETNLQGELKFVCNYGKGSDAKNYTITPYGLKSENYNIKFIDGILTVNKKTLSVTANDLEITYGDGIPNFTVNYDGFINGDDETNLQGELKFVCNYGKGSDAKNYKITPYGLESENYNIKFIDGILTVNKKALSVMANDLQITYGDDIPNYTVNYDGFINGDDETNLQGELSFGCDYQLGSPVGDYEITPKGLTSKNYKISFEKGKLTVIKKQLKIIAKDFSIKYGDNLPEFEAISEGLIDSDNESDLLKGIQFNCDYHKGMPVNSYEIIPNNVSLNNYEIEYISGNLTVNKKNITIKIDTVASIKENEFWQNSNWDFVNGLIGDDKIIGTISTTKNNVGVYTANGNNLGNDFKAENFEIVNGEKDKTDCYNITYEISVELVEDSFNYTASDVTKVYDGNAYSINVNTPLETAEITYSTDGKNYIVNKPEFSQVGEHTVYFKITDKENFYSPIIGSKKVIIKFADLNIKINDQTITYGDERPNFSYEVLGFVNGENESVLTGNIEFVCEYKKGYNAGKYEITANGITADNYMINYINGTLTVNKKALNAIVEDNSILYGNKKPNFNINYEGFVGGDTADNLNGNLEFYCNYIVSDHIGDYAVRANGLQSANYTINYIKGTLTVEPRPISIIVDDKSIQYGQIAPKYSAHSNGFVCNDTMDCINDLKFLCEYKLGFDVGTYTINAKGLNANYVITFICGNLEVKPSPLTINVDAKTIIYGDKLPNFTANSENFLCGDKIDCIDNLKFDCSYCKGSNIGKYEITASGNNKNYDINFKSNFLIVEPKNTDVIWDGLENNYKYNKANQSDKITAKFISAIDGSLLNAEILFSGTGTVFLNAGTYNVTANSDNKNYVLTNNEKSLTMQKGDYENITHPSLNGIYSPKQTLADFALNENFIWASPNDVPNCIINSYSAVYNADKANYNDYKLTVKISLEKATVDIDNNIFEAVFDNNQHSFLPDINYKGNRLDKNLYNLSFSSDNIKTKAGTYKIIVKLMSDNYKMDDTACYMKIKSVLVGDTYYTIEDALKNASGGTIIVTADTSFADIDNNGCYQGDEYYTLKSGVTLLVPFDDTYNTDTNITKDDADGARLGNKYVLLTIPSGISLNVFGNLNINAVRSHYQTNRMGHTSGNYGQIHLEPNSDITLNDGANLYCNGFVTGVGEINALSGSKVYDVLAIKDWRGGTVSLSIYKELFIFNQYTMQNIEAHLKINYGAEMYAKYYIYTRLAQPKGEMIVVGDGAIFGLTNGYLDKFFDAETGRTELTLYGTMNTNYASIKIPGALFVDIEVNTKNLEFPINGNISLILKSGSIANIQNRFKFLPGAECIVEQNATVNVTDTGSLYFFGNGVQLKDVIYRGNKSFLYSGAECSKETRTKNINYSLSDNARFIVNGIFNMAGKFGGLIETTGTTGEINLTGTLASTIKENLNVTKVKQLSVDYECDNVEFTTKAYMNGESTATELTKGTYHADPNGSNTWVKK